MEAKVDVKKDIKKEKAVSPKRLIWNRLKKNKLAMSGLVVLIVMILFTLVGPFLTGYTQEALDFANPKAGPSLQHLMGTDNLGRDVLTRLMYGGRISIAVGVVSVIVEVVIGSILGVVAGYYGGIVDSILMRIVDIILCVPTFPILIVLGAILSDLKVPPQDRIGFLMLIIGFLSWPSLCRLVRGEVLSLREQEYMQASEALGLSDSRKMFKHLLPNTVPTIIVTATLGIGSNILYESSLSYLGLGVMPPAASWGNMIQAVNDSYTMQHYPWLWIPPGLLILLTVVAINILGDGLRDALDPKLKK
ncbi:oligopeptide ABC transporter permease [Clostridium hydrogenum]|uniref:oligopeptide ABC transporter permease n=1 Tax=Clostridium hydrogenum TaxID=2855764 RepID=UPI001F363BF0|nr:oligopeptide ABC transporter permease [Clostridium hydrogenum]